MPRLTSTISRSGTAGAAAAEADLVLTYTVPAGDLLKVTDIICHGDAPVDFWLTDAANVHRLNFTIAAVGGGLFQVTLDTPVTFIAATGVKIRYDSGAGGALFEASWTGVLLA